MEKLHQRSVKNILSFAIIIFFSWSCDEDKVGKKGSFVLTIDATTLSAGTYSSFIIISDLLGNPVIYEEVKKGQKYDIPVKGKFADDLFTLTELYVYPANAAFRNNSSARTYMGLPVQDLTWAPMTSGTSATIHYSRFSFTNFPSVQSMAISSNGQSSTLYPYNSSVSLSVLNNTSYLMASTVSGTQIKYKFFTNDNAGYDYRNTNTIDLSLMTTLPVKSFVPSSGFTNPFLSVKGILKSGPGAGYYDLPRAYLLVPDLGTLFDDYLYFYRFAKGNFTYLNRTHTNLDTDPLTHTVTLKSKTNLSLTYTTSGTYDYDRFHFNYSTTESSGTWYVYAPRTDTEQMLRIPTIPQEIISKYPYTDPNLHQLQTFKATDIKSISSYQDFFNQRVLDYYSDIYSEVYSPDMIVEVKTSEILSINL